MDIKVGAKKSGSYIDFMKCNPAEEFRVLARGSNTSKAVYVASVMKDDYDIVDFVIDSVDIGRKEPLAVVNIVLRAKNVGKYEKRFE